jgi:hypothetical protein
MWTKAKPLSAVGAGGFAVLSRGQYRISKIKYAVSIMTVTLVTESTKASRASL